MAEVELKFELAPEAHAAFRRLGALAGVKARNARLHALYFDTPEFALRGRSMALRLRRTGRHWMQTLKAGKSGAGGLHAREEWEHERPDASLDLAAFAGTPLGAEQDLAERLSEIFRVDVRRTTWELEVSPGNRVEVALDRGEVTRLGEREAVAEVEIESLAGDPLAVFEMADLLIEAAPLRPSSVTKAQRGYRLALGADAGPVKARAVALEPQLGAAAAAHAVMAGALEQLQANEAGVLASVDPEYLHQMRVALRRLRSALRVFQDSIDAPFAAHLRAELGWLARATGAARDWDVLATQTLPAILHASGESRAARSVRARVAIRRKAAREPLREALLSPRYARLVLALARWLAAPLRAAVGDDGLAPLALRTVAKRHKRLVAGALRLSALTPAERHRLRLEAKRLRYALEGFETLFRRRRYDEYRELLAEIQDDLGRANDAAVAARLMAELGAPATLTQFARGWLAAQTHSSVTLLERHADRLATAKLPREKS